MQELMYMVGLVLVFIVAFILIFKKPRPQVNRDFSSLHGTARLLAMIDCINELNAYADQSMFAAFWRQSEAQLRAVLADNTPDTKRQLVDALNEAHAYCRDRDLAKSIIAMRNEILDGVD